VQLALSGIGRKFQKPSVFEALTVAENLDSLSAAPTAPAEGGVCAQRSRRSDAVDGFSNHRLLHAMRRPHSLARPEAMAGDRHVLVRQRRWCC